MVNMEPHDVLFFATAEELRDWLDANHQTADEVWLGYYRKSSGRPSVRWEEVVDEALCVGWVDSVRKGVDAVTSAQRLTPRRKGSTWSARNVANVERLAADGRMRPAGLAAFEARTAGKIAIYSYEQPSSSLSEEELTRFQADEAAWTDWEQRPPSYRRTVTHWITSAKQAATRERRLAALIGDSHAGRALRQFTWTRKSP